MRGDTPNPHANPTRRRALLGLAGAAGATAAAVATAAPAAADTPIQGVSPLEWGPLTYGENVSAAAAEQNRATIQAAIDAAAATGRTVILPGEKIRTPGLQMRGNLRMRGELGTTLIGSGGVPALIIDVRTQSFYGGQFDQITFWGSGGPAVEKIGDAQAPTYTYWNDCTFRSYDAAGFLWHGAGSEQYFTRCRFQGGPCGIETDFRPPTPGALDSFQFFRCHFGGKSLAKFATKNSSGWLFDRCGANTWDEHGYIIENLGGITGWVWRDSYANENACRANRANRVTGTATSRAGSPVFALSTVTNASGGQIRPGDLLTVEAAGHDWGLYESRVTDVDVPSSTVTCADPAATTVEGGYATNAEYDVIHVTGPGAGSVGSFTNCAYSQGSGGNVRFGLNVAPTLMVASVVPAYDKYLTGVYIQSVPPMTRPAKGGNSGSVIGSVSAAVGRFGNYSTQPSVKGGDYVVSLAAGGPNYTAPWGEFAVYKQGVGGGRLFGVTSDGHAETLGGIRPGRVTTLPTPDSTWRGRIVRVEGAPGTADTAWICNRTATGVYEWKQIA